MRRHVTIVNRLQSQVNRIRNNHQAPTITSNKPLIHWIQSKVPTRTVRRKSQMKEVEMMELCWLVIHQNHCKCAVPHPFCSQFTCHYILSTPFNNISSTCILIKFVLNCISFHFHIWFRSISFSLSFLHYHFVHYTSKFLYHIWFGIVFVFLFGSVYFIQSWIFI